MASPGCPLTPLLECPLALNSVYQPCPNTQICREPHNEPFLGELDFGGLPELFVALLEPFIDQFVTTDDRERNHAISGRNFKRFWVLGVSDGTPCWE